MGFWTKKPTEKGSSEKGPSEKINTGTSPSGEPPRPAVPGQQPSKVLPASSANSVVNQPAVASGSAPVKPEQASKPDQWVTPRVSPALSSPTSDVREKNQPEAKKVDVAPVKPADKGESPIEAARAGQPAPRSSHESLQDYINSRYGNVRSALGVGTTIQGKLTFDTPVRIDGKLTGEIYSTTSLIVGPQGVIDAKVEVAALVVMGSVKGNIHASSRLELYSGAELEGEVATPILMLEEGARFNGKCSMLSSRSGATGERKDEEKPDQKKAEESKEKIDERSFDKSKRQGAPVDRGATSVKAADRAPEQTVDQGPERDKLEKDKLEKDKQDQQKGGPQEKRVHMH